MYFFYTENKRQQQQAPVNKYRIVPVHTGNSSSIGTIVLEQHSISSFSGHQDKQIREWNGTNGEKQSTFITWAWLGTPPSNVMALQILMR